MRRESYSSLDTMMQCPKKYELRYVLRYVPVREDSEALNYGTGTHTILECHHGGRPIEFPEIQSYLNASLVALTKGYIAFWGDEPSEMVEKEFDITIGEQPMVAKIDMIRNGHVVDHKSASQIGESYWDKKSVDAQPCIYILAGRQHGIEIDGCVFNVLRKPGKPKQGESVDEYYQRVTEDIAKRPEFYFQRRTYYRTDRELEKTAEDIQNISKMIQAGIFPRNTRSCFDFGRACEYFQCCHGGEIIHESKLFKKREPKNEPK